MTSHPVGASAPVAATVAPAKEPVPRARPSGGTATALVEPQRPVEQETMAAPGPRGRKLAEPSPAVDVPGLSDSDLATIMRPSTSGIPDLEQIRQALNKIAEIINDDERPQEDYSSGDFTTVDMRLSQVAELIPSVFPGGQVPRGHENTMAGVVVEDLYAQLGKGKVVTTVGRMVDKIPEDLLSPDYGRFLRDDVSIPLNMVVKLVRPDELMKRTSHEERDPDLDNMPNLFSRPGLGKGAPPEQLSAPPAPAKPAPIKSPPPPAAVTPPPPLPRPVVEEDPVFGRRQRAETPLQAPPGRLPFYTEEPASKEPAAADISDTAGGFVFEVDDSAPVFKMAEPAPTAPARKPAADVPAPKPAAPVPVNGAVVLCGVDLNRASADDLAARLDGVGQRLAARIVRFREQNGPYLDVTDLARVPGVGPATYEKVTGQSWSMPRDSVRRALDYVLGSDPSEMPDLRKVAERLGDLSGVSGCLFTHQDGYTLAESWRHASSEILGVIAPQIFKKMLTYAEQLDMGELNPVTLFVGDDAISVMQSGDIYLSMIHGADKLGKRHIRLLQLVGAELDVRLEKSKPTF